MRTFFRIFFLVAGLLASTGKDGVAEDNLRVEHLPKLVRQGDVCLLRASGPAALKSIHGEFQGNKFPMAAGVRDGIFEGLLGIDLNTRPATYKIKVVATDGEGKVYSRSLLLKVRKVDFKTQRLSLPSSMVDLDPKTLERVDEESRRVKALFQSFRDEKLWRGAFIRPLEGEISTAFGLRRVINGRTRNPHTGVDLKAEEGTPVMACNRGIVAFVDQFFFSGKSVVLDHGWGLYSMYFHLSRAQVDEGDRVLKGAVIGRVGSTGRSSGPHLHWGIIINEARVDPLSLLKSTKHGGE